MVTEDMHMPDIHMDMYVLNKKQIFNKCKENHSSS